MSEQTALIARKASSAQTIKYRVTPMPGVLMSCEGVGGQLDALGKLFVALSKADGDKVHALVGGIGMEEDGSITFTIVIAPEKAA